MGRRIVILGGGASSLFAAWHLVESAPEDTYDITVYQVGWRLGGKGASGRRSSDDKRIEEHGLHLMFGFYENVFSTIRAVYARHYGDPTMWQRFFKSDKTAVSMIRYLDDTRTKWEPWRIPYPTENAEGTPGDGLGEGDNALGNIPLTKILQNALRWVEGLVVDHTGTPNHGLMAHLETLALEGLHGLIAAVETVGVLSVGACWGMARALLGRVPVHGADAASVPHYVRSFETLIDFGVKSLAHLWRGPEHEALLSLLQFMLTVVRGLFIDLVVRGSSNWFELDRYDLRAWIHRHGGDRAALVVEGLYDAVFASYSELGTGAILQAALKAALLFKGSVIYKMQAGMGDTIFAPLYCALAARKVKFRFFHRVESLTPSADLRFVDSIVLEQQVVVDDYKPLIDVVVDVGGKLPLKCWPSEPIWDQIPEPERHRIVDGKIDLENHWTPPDPTRHVSLRRGVEGELGFDDVILGISVAALPELCPQLLAGDPRFEAHVTRLAGATTATQAMQLWTAHGRTPEQPNPLIVPNVDPYDTVADMCHLLPAECHPASTVGGVHYLCSALYESSPPPPRHASSAHEYPAALRRLAADNGREWVTKRAPLLWSNLVKDDAFDWSALYDPSEKHGDARFDAQYVSTPQNLSDRYVIPAPGTHEVRLMSNGTIYQNLYLTGDWIKTSLSIGCLEAAAMAGIQAARAIALETDNPPVPRAWGDWIDDVTRRQPAAAPAGRPRFRRRDGEFLVPPPYELRCEGLFVFILRADRRRLQAVCDNELNLGSAGYRPYGDFVVLYGATLANLVAGTVGRTHEAGIWLPVLDHRDSGVRIYSPYIWVDSSTSTITGRSVYGYAKQTGDVSVPSKECIGALTVTADALVATATDKSLQRKMLLTASCEPQIPQSPLGLKPWADLVAFLARNVKPDARDLVDVLGGMKSLFLKQLPDVSGPGAAYQALVEAEIALNPGSVGGYPLGGRWQVKIPTYHEPRLVDRLGLSATTTFEAGMLRTSVVTPIAQIWMQFAGTLKPGVVVSAA